MLLVAFLDPARACTPIDVTDVMNGVGDALDEGRPEEGLDRLTDAWTGVADACGPVSSADLALLAQRAGALAWDLGRESVSDGWYEAACTVAPDVPVPPGLGAKAAERAAIACARVRARPRARAVAASDVVLDGAPRRAATRTFLQAGEHLVVWQDQGAWKGRWQPITGETSLELPSGHALSRPKLGAPIGLMSAGIGLAGAGAGLLQVAFTQHWNQQCNGHGIDFYEDGWRACEEQLGVSLSPGYYGGMALLGGGAAIGLTGIGMGVHALVGTPGVSLSMEF